MPIFARFPSGDDGGWPTGTWEDIDESIASADGAVLSTNTGDDVVIIDVGDFDIDDADTVDLVFLNVRARDTGSGGKNKIAIDLDFGGGGILEVVPADNLTNSFVTYLYGDALWNVDWTAAQMNNLQLIIRAGQTGMPTAADWEIDAIDIEALITLAGGSQVLLQMAQYKPT